MLTTKINAKLSSLLFRANKLQQLIENERRVKGSNSLRLMRLNTIRLRVLNSMHNLLSLAFGRQSAPQLARVAHQR